MTTWFTSDTHFGHKRIVELAKRPFKSTEEMDEAMIGMWNACVKPGDTIYHLGDFAFADHDNYLPKLNGTKYLLRGNHDHRDRISRYGWSGVFPSYHEIKIEGQMIILCHYALRVWRNSGHGSIHLYGHSHGNLPGDNQCCDVGVDAWNFTPTDLEHIKIRLSIMPHKREEPDHHKHVSDS